MTLHQPPEAINGAPTRRSESSHITCYKMHKRAKNAPCSSLVSWVPASSAGKRAERAERARKNRRNLKQIQTVAALRNKHEHVGTDIDHITHATRGDKRERKIWLKCHK